jgi:hypothetical protein
MMPRLAADADAAAAMVLKDLGAGLNLIGLHREQWHLPVASQRASAIIFAGLAAHYRGDARRPASPGLSDAIDAAIAPLLVNPAAYKEALMILSGLRSVLFPGQEPPLFFEEAA